MKPELKEQYLRVAYENWLNSWVGDPRISFEDFCEGKFKHDQVEIDFDKCSELTNDGKLIIYFPDFIKEIQKNQPVR